MANSEPPHRRSHAAPGFTALGGPGGMPGPGGDFSMMTWSVRGGMVLSLGGELDIATASLVTDRVRALVAEGHVRIVLDLAHLEFCDCSGLRALLRVQRIATEAGGWARLSRVGDMIRQIITLTGLRDVIVCYDNVSAAIAVRGTTVERGAARS